MQPSVQYGRSISAIGVPNRSRPGSYSQMARPQPLVLADVGHGVDDGLVLGVGVLALVARVVPPGPVGMKLVSVVAGWAASRQHAQGQARRTSTPPGRRRRRDPRRNGDGWLGIGGEARPTAGPTSVTATPASR